MKKTFALILISVFTAGFASAQNSTELHKKLFNLNKNDLAIQSFDPVSYFNEKKALGGKKDIALTTEGITYRFATAQYRDLLKATRRNINPNSVAGMPMPWARLG